MRKGFTLIELVMVIVILGILAAVAIPKYFSLQSDARQSAEKGVVGGVRAGIATYYADQCRLGTCAWPNTLDAAIAGSPASQANPFFVNVLAQGGVTSDWNKDAADATISIGPSSGEYTYDNTDGSFLKTGP